MEPNEHAAADPPVTQPIDITSLLDAASQPDGAEALPVARPLGENP